MQKFKDVLTPAELKNPDTVKNYLEYSFRRRRTKKNLKLYINICLIFEFYPKTIKDVLNNIPSLGYYKDYFYILSYSKNIYLTAYIFDLIGTQLRLDLHKMESGEKISTLGKWLPREKSSINTKCNFVDKFCRYFFPCIVDKFAARRRYRLMKTTINRELGTLEAKICTGQLDTINYDKVSPFALKKATAKLMKNDLSRENLDAHKTKILQQKSLSEFTKEIVIAKTPTEKINMIWQQNNFLRGILPPNIKNLLTDAVCVVDLSKDTYELGGEFFTIAMALLVDQYSSVEKKIIIGNTAVQLRGTITDKTKQLLRWIGPCKLADIHTYADPSIKCIVFITSKQIQNITSLRNTGVKFLQFIPLVDTYNVTYYNGKCIKTFTDLSHTTDKVVLTDYKTIKMITNSSSEVRDVKTPVCIIIRLCLLLFAIRVYGIFFRY